MTSTTTRTNLIMPAIMGFAIITAAVLALPVFAQAASYAYVDAAGEVKMVVANDWMSAIATAPGIHINSGVFLLTSASDFAAVGDTVVGAK